MGLVSPEASLLGLPMATFYVLIRPLPRVQAGTPGASKDTGHTGSGPHPVTSFNLSYLPEGTVSRCSHTRG